MIVFHKIRFKNLLSYGNDWTEVDFQKVPMTVLSGANGSGKCFCINTPITVRNKETGEVIRMTIGELYEIQKRSKSRGKTE